MPRLHLLFPALVATMAIFLWCAGSAAEASTETLSCTRPTPPAIPNGATTAFFEMETTSREMQNYLQQMDAYIACLSQEAEAARAEQNSTVNAWNASVDQFNAR